MASAFEWDPAKRASNLAKHGVDFPRAAEIFAGPVVVFEDLRRPYGEERFLAIGRAGELLLTVAYTPRDAAIRIISARKAYPREQRAYGRLRPEEA